METSIEFTPERGKIRRRSASRPEEFVLRRLDKNDLPAISKLQASVVAALEPKELYVPIPEAELRLLLDGAGETMGLFIGRRLYAACAILFQVDEGDNMARELGFPEDQLTRVAQLELSLVDDELRGYKLQQKLAGLLADRAKSRPGIRYLFTTVSPYNYPSMATLTSLGLWVAKLGKMYYDWDRYVVYRDFWHPVRLDTARAILLPATGWDEQQALLAQGYRGFAVSQNENGIQIAYAPLI
jgi:ribosomal protein S18 acetylase RimI-like enzyme